MLQSALSTVYELTKPATAALSGKLASAFARLPADSLCKSTHLKMQGLLLQEWNKALLANDEYWDQNAFNDLMNRGARFSEQRTDRLFL